MVDKRHPRRPVTWLPRWAASSLGLFIIVTALLPLAGPHLSLYPLYLLPILLATEGGLGPGLAMTAAAWVAEAGLGARGGAPFALVVTDGLALAGVGSILVVRTALAERRLERYRREGEAARELLRFARHSGSPADLPAFLRSVADGGSRLLGADYGATFLWEPRTKQFRAAQQSPAAEQAGVRFSGLSLPAAGSPVIAQLLRGPGVLTVLDATRAPDWAQVVHGLPICRALLVPAVSWGRVLGCLLFGRGPAGLPFQEPQQRLARAMAEHVAVALEHADAFQALERQGDQIRGLNRDLERQNARLIELEQFRNDLVHMIVHDMRAPLSAMIASMRWVEREAGTGLAPPLAEAHRIGRQGAEELLGMVNDLLDVARMEEGHLELELSVERVPVLVAAAREATRYLALDRRHELRVAIPTGLSEVSVDREKVIRVLVNLIGNAIKFTPAGGRIELSARPVEAGWIGVTVADSGEGVPLEEQARIFEKFGQVKNRQGGRTMSTGLGLAFCKLAIEAHGGQISVESQPGEGARFTLTLPVAHSTGRGGGGADAA